MAAFRSYPFKYVDIDTAKNCMAYTVGSIRVPVTKKVGSSKTSDTQFEKNTKQKMRYSTFEWRASS